MLSDLRPYLRVSGQSCGFKSGFEEEDVEKAVLVLVKGVYEVQSRQVAAFEDRWMTSAAIQGEVCARQRWVAAGTRTVQGGRLRPSVRLRLCASVS